MVARRWKGFSSEQWDGLWGADARYYARRSDGACFAIDGAVTMLDLAGAAPPAALVEPVASIPEAGRYTLRVVAARPLAESGREHTGPVRSQGTTRGGPRRMFACGVRRSSPR